MTGYGRASETFEGVTITVELKSVNNRYLDCTVKAGRQYLFLEEPVKKATSGVVSRGRLDIFVTVDESNSEDTYVKLNKNIFEAYLTSFRKMCADYNLRDDISVTSIARFPDVVEIIKGDTDIEKLTSNVLIVLSKALDDFNTMRIHEGEQMKQDIKSRAETIEKLVDDVIKRAPDSVKAYRQRIEETMRELLAGARYDETRLLMETALYADRCCVDEETVRLQSHIAQLYDILERDEPVGRKLDFLLQEFNREVNTIGSKCVDIDITSNVLEIKAELEKIREQIQNIE
ncbi:MAG: YicC family protein [Clostridiales bacterium]|nr:YicC family protein [Clostridiales bacterium]